MVYLSKKQTKVRAALVAIIGIVAIAVWQFYLFVTFQDAQGVLDAQNGTNHLWWAIGAALLACLVGFVLFSSLVRYDQDQELHITS